MRKSNGFWLLLVATLSVTALVFTIGGTQPNTNRNFVRTKPLEWGLYQILWSKDYQELLGREYSKFASKPDYVMFYRDLGRPFPAFPIRAIEHHGATPIISLELWTWHGGRKGTYLPAINEGKYDTFFKTWAKAAQKHGRRVLLRFGFEFNGDWFTWSGDPKSYVKAWRRVRHIFNENGANNVEWVWSPNIVSCPDQHNNNMHLYYPGDDYVDWVGVDGYNFGEHHDQWHHWQSFEEIYSDLLKSFAIKYRTKPLMIAEFGAAPGKGNQRPIWIRKAFQYIQQYPQVKAAVWFHLDKRREGEPDWRIDVTPASLKAFNETFAKP